jgi:hypothetical protein
MHYDLNMDPGASRQVTSLRALKENLMKLRIAGNSLRLRVSRSDLARLMQSGRIEETIHFAAEASAQLSYALEQSQAHAELSVVYRPQVVTVLLPGSAAREWAEGDEVGIYGDVDTGISRLAVIVEKDFACLDRSERDNIDRFPNPHKGAVC